MITEFLLSIMFGTVNFVLESFPIISEISVGLGAVYGFIELIAYGSIFMPFDALFLAFGVWMSLHGVKFSISIVNWLIGKIPTID